MRESDELSSSQQGGAGESEEEQTSPIFEEIMHLWEKASQQVRSRSFAPLQEAILFLKDKPRD